MAGALDFRALERESYRLKSDTPASIRMTPELIGRLIACLRQVYGVDPHDVVPPDFFDQLLMKPTTPVPDRIAEALHVETRVDGPHVEELTRMLVGPQASGLAGRLNPNAINLIPKAGVLQAYLVLGRYESLFPGEVAWLKEAMRKAEAQGAGGTDRNEQTGAVA